MQKVLFNEDIVTECIKSVEHHFKNRPKIVSVFKNCFMNTLEKTLSQQTDGSIFMVTGDIPAMWLRDSSAQLKPYLQLAEKDTEISKLIAGVLQKQIQSVLLDPYANAYNESGNGRGHQNDKTDMSPAVWERKYEIDSLCYPVELSYLYWKHTGNRDVFDSRYLEAVEAILTVWEREQNHEEDSFYRFERENCPPSDTLPRNGKGSVTKPTGMTWSGFRPSDDACQYGYLIPSNMFACVVLGYIEEIAVRFYRDEILRERASKLKKDIQEGIETYGVYTHPKYGKIYAYETDGFGNFNLMDDANVPSLLSMPYIGYCSRDDSIYQNTRSFILSHDNPYFYEGANAKGIGSPHTPVDYVWHIALAIQGITASSLEEKEEILTLFEKTDGGTGFMHEGFDVNDPAKYTREWFSWANAMFCEFVMNYIEHALKK